MKKFTIVVVLLIPFVVLVAILASSAIITVTGTPVNPTSMVIKDVMGNSFPDSINIDYYGENVEFEIYVYPSVTQDKSVSFIYQEGDGEVEFAEGQAGKYTAIPKKTGVVQYLVRLNANINIYRTITFNVTSDVAESVHFFDAYGDELEGTKVITCAERIYVEATPISAMQSVAWDSEDVSVVYVDGNGKLYPRGLGKVTVQAVVTDKKGNLITKSIVVDTKSAVASSDIAYCTSEINEEWVLENVALDRENTTITRLDEENFKLTRNVDASPQEAVVKVVGTEPQTFGFLDDISEVFTNNGTYNLQVGYLDSAFAPLEGVVFMSDDYSVIDVHRGGTILPNSVGAAKITATYGGNTTSKTIVVKERPAFLALSLDAADGKRGIEQTRVWGQRTMKNGELTEGVELSLKNTDVSYDVDWTATGEATLDIAEGGKAIVVKFGDGDRGTAVTVTATLRLGERLVKATSKSFTYNVLPGEKAINIYDFPSLEKAVNRDFELCDLAIQSDIWFESVLIVRNSIYGNGFSFRGDNVNYEYLQQGLLKYAYWYMHNGDGEYPVDEITVQNLHICAHNPETFEINARDHGICIKFDFIDIPVNIRYCEFEYAQINVHFYLTKNITMEGCIIGDAQKTGIEVQCGAQYDAKDPRNMSDAPYEYHFRNNVFKKSGAASIEFSVPSEGRFDIQYLPDLYFEGFCDCYNWKKKSEITNMFTMALTDALAANGTGADLSGLTKLLSDSLSDIVEKTAIKDAAIKYKGEEYVCPAVFIMGIVYKTDVTKVHNNTTNLFGVRVDLCDENGEPIAAASAGNVIVPKIGYFKERGVTNVNEPSYMMGNTFNGNEDDIYPDAPIPASEELYARLRRGI